MKKILILLGIIILLTVGIFFVKNLVSSEPTNTDPNQNKEAQSFRSEWVGLMYSFLPPDITNDGWETIGDARYATHSLRSVTTTNGRELWLESMTKNPDENTIFKVVDILEYPDAESRYYLAWGLCGKTNPSSSNAGIDLDDIILALVNKEQYFSKGIAPATHAYKINLSTEKFESYPPSDIVCITESGPGYSD